MAKEGSNDPVSDGMNESSRKKLSDFSVIRGVTGKVKWFSGRSGYGFITREDNQTDIFVHFSAVVRTGRSMCALAEGEEVEFDVVQGFKGLEVSTLTAPGGKAVKKQSYFRRGPNSRFHRRNDVRNKDESAKQTKSDEVEGTKNDENVSIKEKEKRIAGGETAKPPRHRKSRNSRTEKERRSSKAETVETIDDEGDSLKKTAETIESTT